LILIAQLAVLIVARLAFLFGPAALFIILSPQSLVSLAFAIKPAAVFLSLISSLKFGVATLFVRAALLIKPASIHFLLISSLLFCDATLFFRLTLLIKPASVLFLLNSSLPVSIASLLFCLLPLLVLVLTLLINPAPLFLLLTLCIPLAALLVFALSPLLLLRLSFAIAALLFTLPPLLVLRLSIGVAALFLCLSPLLLLIILPLPALRLIPVVALSPLFADLRALPIPVRTILGVCDDTAAQPNTNAERQQYRDATKVTVFHDDPPARERAEGKVILPRLIAISIPRASIRRSTLRVTTQGQSSDTIWLSPRPYRAAG